MKNFPLGGSLQNAILGFVNNTVTHIVGDPEEGPRHCKN